MNPALKVLHDLLLQTDRLTASEKELFQKAMSDADKQWSITEFNLDRTEKEKRTTAILLEETIAELEQKRAAVEAQNRELEIEAAMERVRTRTMAMQKSGELADVAGLLFKQVSELGIQAWTTGFNVWSDDNNTYEDYITSPQGGFIQPYIVDTSKASILKEVSDVRKRGDEFFVQYAEGERLKELYIQLAGFGDEKQYDKMLEDGIHFPSHQYDHFVFGSKVSLMFITYEPVPEVHDIFKRFGKVFEQTYTRFLDLQKAEAQAREAQIQLALERIRSRSLAMHYSNELKDVVAILFQQLKILGLEFDGGAAIHLFSQNSRDAVIIVAAPNLASPIQNILPYDEEAFINNPIILDVWHAKETGENIFNRFYSFEEKNRYFNYVFKHNGFEILPQSTRDSILQADSYTASFIAEKNSLLGANSWTRQVFSKHDFNVLKRIAKVFEQAYIRFLDLQKAEAQAKEGQIELGLERVRARAMAMQTSEELNELIGTVFLELTKLDLALTRCVIMIFDSSTNGARWWMANSEALSEPMNFYVKYHDLPFFNAYLKGWQERTRKWVFELQGTAKIEVDNFLFTQTELSLLPDFVIAGMRAPDKIYLNASFNNFGNLTLASLEQLSGEHFDILLRFAKVFDQTYTRFNDLKQAEAQAREATIEAALEKVRGKAMAMHNSNDLSVAASMVFTELRNLGINPIRCGVGLLHKESRKAQLYSATSSADGDSLALIGWVLLTGHPVLENIYDTWLKNEEYYPELSGEKLKSYYELLLAGLPVSIPEWQDGQKQYGHFLPFSVGCLYAWSAVPYNDAEIKLLKRFAAIIDLTFRRYIELQQSEANAKEAVMQAALDRIRADIASMRTISDLDRITPLIWNELTILGVPFIRCGVFIMDDSQELIHTFLSTPEGKAIAAFHIPYTAPGKIANVLNHWHEKKNYVDHWDEEAFTEFANMLVEQGGLASSKEYLKTMPHGGFYLHFLPFLQGMLYVGNTTQLNEDAMKVIQSVADAFSVAYARYEDFNNLEAAKEQVESALKELRSAQAQLIQSEKMASLGELTAGIAHEIQNPLNFVNNFSEVSKELLGEMKAALTNGDAVDANEIADNVIQNLEKINQHGQRADAIVKNMLQHSRMAKGEKKATDLNALADEYLRLSYHGLRAKDKTFNANFNTDFDESIGKVDLIPQDIGRVLLNLFNNAFYAVYEKMKKLNGSYEPLVSVSTKKRNNKIEICVQDNGMGISKSLMDKVFQPFFTTKPTGQGTGLGLSLSYDIVKAHGGELNVETVEGEGAAFTIVLPIKD